MVSVVEGDLLDQEVDVIVNAWNRNIVPWWLLLPRGCLAQLRGELDTPPSAKSASMGQSRYGGAVEFAAKNALQGDHSCCWNKSLLAVVGTVDSEDAVAVTPVRIATDRGYRSMAFPLVGAGRGGGKPRRCSPSC